MARLTIGQIFLGKFASVVGIVQAVTWFSMALLCVIEYSVDISPNATESYMDYLNQRLHHFYLDRNANFPTARVFPPVGFLVFMCIYVIFTTMWFVLSLFLISVLKRSSRIISILFKDWALITFFISFVDLVLVMLIGCDYHFSCLPSFEEGLCVNTMIPVLVIAARGFVLWLVNVILAWRLLVNANIMQKVASYSYKGTFGGIIPSFHNKPFNHIPRAVLRSSPSLYSEQYGFISKSDNFWNVNLRTAMDNRTPSASPKLPSENGTHFFPKY